MVVLTKKIVVMLLCAVMLLQATACGDKKSGNNDKGNTVEISGVTVWSAPSTVKIQKDDINYADKGAAELHYNVVRNEYESRQLVLTATKDIKAYDIEVSDLQNGEHVIAKDFIEVYNERYIYANDTKYSPTYMPDPLIPLDAAREHGDLTITKDTNAAFWITIYIPKETPAGVYEGTFKLTVDKGTADIPVKVTVNDYTLTDESTAKTLFSWRYARVGAGELDSSIDMMTKYYEFFLDYRISLQSMPLETLSGEEFTECLEKYYDRISTYCFLSEKGNISTGLYTKEDAFREQVYAVAEMSSPEKNYFEKAMLYVIDEPDIENVEMKRAYALERYQTVKDFLVSFADDIAKDTSGRFSNFKQIPNWRTYIVDMPSIVPTSSDWLLKNTDTERVQSYLNLINCYCPHWNHIESSRLDLVNDLRETYDLDIWWYGSMWPLAPGANYHINNENLLSARSITWLQKKLNIEGNLYWQAASYTTENENEYNQYIDVWSGEPCIEKVPSGDGNLTYPGAAYGIDGPIPSIRLMSIRDGNEEYEMLTDVENSYKALAKDSGNVFDVADVMESFYNSLYDGNVIMYRDGEFGLQFDTLRASLIDTAVLSGKGIHFAMQVADVKDNNAKISYYVSGDCRVFIQDKEQQSVKDNIFEYTIDLEEQTSLTFDFAMADGTHYEITKFVGNPVYLLQALSDESVLEDIIMPEKSNATFVNTTEFSTDGTSILLDVNGVITGDTLEDSLHVPKVTLCTKMFEGIEKLTEVSKIEMDIYNPGSAFSFKVFIYSGATYVQMGTFDIASGKNTISLDIANAHFADMAQADRITFEFVNTEDGVTANTYKFYLDNIVKKE